MVSDKQRLEILSKLAKILYATETCSSIEEVAKQTGIPSSTIQRYLNRADYFEELANEGLLKRENVNPAIEYSKKWLAASKQSGLRRGGLTSQARYGYQKTEGGKFTGKTR